MSRTFLVAESILPACKVAMFLTPCMPSVAELIAPPAATMMHAIARALPAEEVSTSTAEDCPRRLLHR